MMSSDLRVASVNLQHWIKAGGVMIDGKTRTERDYRAKLAWARRVFSSVQPDVLGLQEVYDQESIEKIFMHRSMRDRQYRCYLSGGAAQQVALVTTLELAAPIETVQELSAPITIARNGLQLSVSKLSRPILKARLLHEGEVVTVFVVHLKSKVPSYGEDPSVRYPEEQLLTADLVQRCLGNLVSLVRRGAEAAALRREVVRELEDTDDPVIVCGDLNDRTDAVTTEMICGDPTSTYIPPREGQPYTAEDIAEIRRRLHRTVLTSTQDLQVQSTALSELYTNIHLGKYSSLDHIMLSRHFFRMPHGVVDDTFVQRYYFNYFEVWNDHLVDDCSGFAPKKAMSTDHGLAVAYLKKIPQLVLEASRPVGRGGPEVAEVLEAAESPSDLKIR